MWTDARITDKQYVESVVVQTLFNLDEIMEWLDLSEDAESETAEAFNTVRSFLEETFGFNTEEE